MIYFTSDLHFYHERHIMKNRDCYMISIRNWRMLTVNTVCAGIMEPGMRRAA